MVQFELVNFAGRPDMIGLSVAGHASEYGAHDGKNIVCAAVSTVCDMAVRGCALYDANLQHEVVDGKLRLVCRRMAATEAIIKAAIIELEETRKHYPMCFTKGEGK